jgi:glycosyltransferase involved in cell wall biosynthesis
MTNPSISVAMATFNGARYLGEQLTSLSSQTVKPLELVVCDDGSTDETVAILRSFSALAPFTVRVFKNAERLGYQQNFMKAASLCKGSLIAFCDQDDIWNDDKLDVVTKFFRQSDDLLAAHDFSVFFENDSQLIPSYFRNLALSGLLPVVSLKGCTLTLRRELIELVDWPPPRSRWPHDLWFCFTAHLLEKRGYIRQSLVKHRIHGNNTSGWVTGGKATLQRLLRGFRLPPYANSTDLDSFISQFVGPTDLVAFRDAVRQCGSAMTNDQLQCALSGLAKRQAICDFISSEAYLHPAHRILGAIDLFFGRAYRNGDGMLGFVHDIRGRRTWMRNGPSSWMPAQSSKETARPTSAEETERAEPSTQAGRS